MKSQFKLFVAGILVAVMTVGAFAQASVIKQRKEKMSAIGSAQFRVLGGMVKGEVPYDSAKAQEAIKTMKTSMVGFADLFPVGSETGEKTEAALKIWQDKAGFVAASAKFEETLAAQAANAGKDLAGLRAAFGAINGSCRSCHENYKRPG